MNDIKISVLMPVYNGGYFLKEAIESILSQTYKNYEFLIIDDGSTDNSEGTIRSYEDPRIRLLKNKTNLGLIKTLNIGLSEVKGEYIARMDQDDISLPERLEKQVSFLETHKDHVLVGTTYAYINENGIITGTFPALLDDDELKKEILTKTPFGHGTVMLRRSTLVESGYKYSSNAVHIEDYDLWLRLSKKGKFANLPEILYLWRQSLTNITSKYSSIQQRNANVLRERTFRAQHNLKGLISWPGWRNLYKYHNTTLSISGKSINVCRHDAHCSLYLVLSWLFLQKRQFVRAFIAFVYAFLISPIYIVRATFRII